MRFQGECTFGAKWVALATRRRRSAACTAELEALISANRERNGNLVKHINRLKICAVARCSPVHGALAHGCRPRPGSFNSIMTFSIILYDEKRQKITLFVSKLFPALFFTFIEKKTVL